MTINWSLEELQTAIDEIVSGERWTEVESTDGPVDIFFRYPDRKITRKSDLVMRKAEKRASDNYIMTEQQMLEHITKIGVWTEADEKKAEAVRFQLEKVQEKLNLGDELEKHIKAHYLTKVDQLKEELFTVEYKKEVALANTAERKAQHEKFDFLIWACSYDPETEERVWTTYRDYLATTDKDKILKNNLLSEMSKYLRGRRTEEIRYIARSNLWRISYVVAQKTNTPLFSTAVIDLTPDQTNLAWWSGYYQGIYEMMPDDQPDDATIEDDEALDKYMEELHKERSRERQDARRNKGNPFGSKSARNMSTQLVMRENPDYMDLQYDAPPSHGEGTERTLKDEAPNTSAVARKRSQKIKGSKRFKPGE